MLWSCSDLRSCTAGQFSEKPVIYVLDQDDYEIDGVRFLGTTLWTDFRLYGEAESWSSQQKAFKGSTVVVTHHLPAAPSIASEYRNDPLSPAFASRLEDVIETYQPDLWIHGHTHVACDYEIYGTRVVCNPRGYPSESSARGFSPGLVVEL